MLIDGLSNASECTHDLGQGSIGEALPSPLARSKRSVPLEPRAITTSQRLERAEGLACLAYADTLHYRASPAETCRSLEFPPIDCLQEHRDVVAAICERDPEKAAETVRICSSMPANSA